MASHYLYNRNYVAIKASISYLTAVRHMPLQWSVINNPYAILKMGKNYPT